MTRKCRNCGSDIPEELWASSWYCSWECNYEARKQRSLSRYYQMKANVDPILKADGILATFFNLYEAKVFVTMEMLEAAGFDFGLSKTEVVDKKGRIWKVINNYGYHIDPATKQIAIWKRK